MSKIGVGTPRELFLDTQYISASSDPMCTHENRTTKVTTRLLTTITIWQELLRYGGVVVVPLTSSWLKHPNHHLNNS